MIKYRLAASFIALLLLLSSCGKPGKAVISGRAMSDGAPAAGAEVNVYVSAEKSNIPPAATMKTEPDGRFRAELSPGTYYVIIKVTPTDGSPPYVSKFPADPVTLGVKPVDVGDMPLASGSGRKKAAHGAGVKGIVMRSGKPVVGAMVYLY